MPVTELCKKCNESFWPSNENDTMCNPCRKLEDDWPEVEYDEDDEWDSSENPGWDEPEGFI